MKKKLILLTALIVSFASLQAKKVSIKDAEIVARQTVTSEGNQTRSTSSLTLVHTEFNKSDISIRSSATNAPTYYVFSKGENKGFVIISADDVANPILGYSDKGNYDVSNLPINFESWMEEISDEIAFAIENQLEQTPDAKTAWDNYLSGGLNLRSVETKTAVEPLIQTQWDQNAPYNKLAPSGSYAGCVATVMAQIMKYYNHPASTTKTIPGYTTTTKRYVISSIPARSYDWENMVKTYNGTNTIEQEDAVAQLIYDIGVASKMNYRVEGSSTKSVNALAALTDYFDYSKSAQYKMRSQYTSTAWENLLISEINAGRPVYYAGAGTGAHAFICDGYDESGMFHFNWGWNGDLDGYFRTAALTPGQKYNFNSSQEIIFGIKPSAGPELMINNSTGLTSSQSTLYTGDSFTVKGTLTNLGDADFSGQVGVAIIDANNNIVTVMGEASQEVKQSGSISINLTNSISKSIQSGDYFIRLVSKRTDDSDWSLIAGNGGLVDKVAIKVIYDTRTHRIAIKSGSSLSTTSTSVKTDQKFTVSAQFKNGGTSLFKGNVGIALVNNADEIVEVIGVYGSTLSLSAGSYYMNPFSISCTISESVYTGDYKLRAVAKPTAETEWSIVYGEASSVVDIRSLNVIGAIADPGNLLVLNVSGDLTSDSSTLSPGDSFSVNGTVSNFENKDFSGQIGVAIVNANNNILAVTSETTQQIAQGSSANISINSSLPSSIQAGSYFIRFVSKTSTTSSWLILAGDTGVVDRVAITVESDEPAPKPEPTHSIMIRKGSLLSASASLVDVGQKFTVSAQIKNGASSTFNGKMGIALVDNMDQIVEVIGIYGANLSMPGNSYYGNPFSISCTVPTTVYAGSYKLRAVAKATTEEEWSIIYGEASTVVDILPLNVASSIEAAFAGSDIDAPVMMINSLNGFIKATTSSNVNIQEIRVYNISGMLVYQSSANTSTYTTSQSFQNGVYIVQVKTENGIERQKVIVK